MGTQTELTRLTTARNEIRNKMTELGVALPTDNLTQIATKVNGIINQGAVQAQVEVGQTFTIPAGMHNGSGTVSGVTGDGQFKLQSKTVTPTKSQQNVTPDSGYYGLSDVTVFPIPAQYQDVSGVTASSADVLANRVFVAANGVMTAGTMTNNGAAILTMNGLNVTSINIPQGFHNGGGTVSLTNDIEMALAAI